MYRVTLSDDQRQDLQRRMREADLSPSTHDRLEMVRRSNSGWSVPTIARHLGQHAQTVRFWIKAFPAGGFDALVNQPRGGKESALSPAMIDALRRAKPNHHAASRNIEHLCAAFGSARLDPENSTRITVQRRSSPRSSVVPPVKCSNACQR